MALKLQELHPALVHFPIALMPVSLISDLLGRLTEDEGLLELGRMTMPIAAVSNAVAGMAGLIAQETVQGSEEASKMLVTHRTLNVAALGVTALMALRRVGQKQPGAGYLAMGFATLGVVTYSAYLGSKMVYAKGMGVEKADGLRPGSAPELRLKNAGEVARVAAGHLRDGIKHAIEDASDGEFLPMVQTDVERAVGE
jgi:uncharacterized membrane protein